MLRKTMVMKILFFIRSPSCRTLRILPGILKLPGNLIWNLTNYAKSLAENKKQKFSLLQGIGLLRKNMDF